MFLYHQLFLPPWNLVSTPIDRMKPSSLLVLAMVVGASALPASQHVIPRGGGVAVLKASTISRGNASRSSTLPRADVTGMSMTPTRACMVYALNPATRRDMLESNAGG